MTYRGADTLLKSDHGGIPKSVLQLGYLQHGVLSIPGGKGRHSPIAADDPGRAIAALLKNPEGHIGTVINLSGPVEMNYEQMTTELSEALGRKVVYQDLPIEEYTASLTAMGLPPYCDGPSALCRPALRWRAARLSTRTHGGRGRQHRKADRTEAHDRR